MTTTKTQRAAAEQVIGYTEAWIAKNAGPMIGSVKVLVSALERAAGPVAMAEAMGEWEARMRRTA
ncbi:MAG: hypothetical protein KAJ19_23885 [Gammaproteobacteria bacterium]|nr:hypothetical protein [Gammaproteobacteria bacterium]